MTPPAPAWAVRPLTKPNVPPAWLLRPFVLPRGEFEPANAARYTPSPDRA